MSSINKLRIILFCQTIDINDPVLATTVSWVSKLLEHDSVERVRVYCIRLGDHPFAGYEGLDIVKIGGASKISIIMKVFLYSFRDLMFHKYNCFFVYQNGFYQLITKLNSIIFKAPIFQWLAHPKKNILSFINIKILNHRTFTPSENSVPYLNSRVRISGHGVDPRAFNIFGCLKDRQNGIHIGRISPVKDLEQILAISEKAVNFQIHCFGPKSSERDRIYFNDIFSNQTESNLIYHGSLNHDKVSDVLNNYKFSIFCCEGALGKFAVESLLCGVPCISDNSSYKEVLPIKLARQLVFQKGDIDTALKLINQILHMPDSEYKDLCLEIRDYAKNNHSVDNLINTIVDEMLRSVFQCSKKS